MQTKNLGWLLIGACALVYLCGWHIPLMEIDAVQYANISREMLHSGDFLQILDRGKDYLDKPPMLFWLSALSMRLFGISDAAYRLPSFLFSLLAIYSTYRLAALFYRKEVALLSAVVLASCQALFLINHDVRTDTLLMGWVIFSLWQLAAWYKTGSWGNLLLASVALAGGMMTKGPIALMIPVFAFVPHFLLTRNYRRLFRWEYIPMLLVTGILLIPMCIGLYRQYDLHPGKVIDGLTIQSGLRFFFWTQSFGRVTGESQWHENDSFTFLFQNMLWSFLPWIIFFVIGLVRDFRHLWRRPQDQEWISTGGFVVTYCALGMSHYQLPHYIFVVFPLAAIIAAKAFYALFQSREAASKSVAVSHPAAGSAPIAQPVAPPPGRHVLFVAHVVIFALLWIALILLLWIPFPTVSHWIAVIAAVAAGIWVWLLCQRRGGYARLLWLSVYTIVGVNFFLDIGFYPALLQYQLHAVVMKGMKERHIAPDHLYVYRMDEERALDFYTDHLYQHVSDTAQLTPGAYLLTNQQGLDSLGAHPGLSIIYSGAYFHVSTLDLPFLNPATRKEELKPVYILEKRCCSAGH